MELLSKIIKDIKSGVFFGWWEKKKAIGNQTEKQHAVTWTYFVSHKHRKNATKHFLKKVKKQLQ